MAIKFNKHSFLMILCCAVPLIFLLVGVYFFDFDRKYLIWLMVLLCPLMHYLLMRDMHKGHSEKGSGKNLNKKESCH